MLSERENRILAIVANAGGLSSSDVTEREGDSSKATIKRELQALVDSGFLTKSGQGRSTRYTVSPAYDLIRPIDTEGYYKNDIDERDIREDFNWDLLRDVLPKVNLFNNGEISRLNALQDVFVEHTEALSDSAYRKELERLAIDLSWKSSQIEGNTYSLLETERLLREKKTAEGKTKEEAVMLLNHKSAIDFLIDNRDYLDPLTVSNIESIHSLLVKELDVDRNIRTRRVGISGTNYRPLDNEFQIKEAMSVVCDLVNSKEIVFEKALLSLVLISYIQPFMDGNKRTARIVSNAMLLGNGYCPISFRTVDATEYKKAMLLFYEQNNIYNFKQIFIDQFAFAVDTYF
jgi:Fic family protein